MVWPRFIAVVLCCLLSVGCGSSGWPDSSDGDSDGAGQTTPMPTDPEHQPGPATPMAPTPTPEPDLVCGTTPECECLINECLPLPVPVSLACEIAREQAPNCLERLLAALAVGGCGPSCGGLTLPGLDILCDAPECEPLAGLLFGPILPDVCSHGCDCQPDCADRSCGDDGCGGFCGSCDPGDACEQGRCEEIPPPCEVDAGGCPCALNTCLPIASAILPLDDLCQSSFLPDSCATVLTDTFVAEGCGPVCKGLTVPGLEALCEMPECGDFLDLGALVGARNICQCFCEPQCGGNVCGPDGCGGVCGQCADGESCGFGECLTVAGECTGSDFSCYCATRECESSLPLGQRLSICSLLSFGNPECGEVVMRAYAAQGCQTSPEEPDIFGKAAICSSSVCAEFRDELLAETGLDPCSPPISSARLH